MTTKISHIETMANAPQELSLRRVAARFISHDEQKGLDELDDITREIYGIIRLKYWITIVTAGSAAMLFIFSMILTFAAIFINSKLGNLLCLVDIVFGLIMLAAIGYWRCFQYGFASEPKRRKALYSPNHNDSVENLEKFFALVQSETKPRVYYYKRNGQKEYLKRQQFFGSLRALLLSEISWIREPATSRISFFESPDLYMNVDIDTLIALAKAKPSAGGAPKSHDYTDAIISIIEHPMLKAIRFNEQGKANRGAQKMIREALKSWYFQKRKRAPSDTQLNLYVNMILDAIRKNRGASN